MRGTWQTTDSGARPGVVLLAVGGLIVLASGGAAAVARSAEAALWAAVIVTTLTAAGFGVFVVSIARKPRMVHVTRVLPPAAARELPAREPAQIVNNYFGGQHVHGMPDAVPVIRQALKDG